MDLLTLVPAVPPRLTTGMASSDDCTCASVAHSAADNGTFRCTVSLRVGGLLLR
jgi:hypothetical protein